MRGLPTSPVDLLWLLLLPVVFVLFHFLRRPRRSAALVACLAIVSMAVGWAVFYAWMTLTLEAPRSESAFNSVEFLRKEPPDAWLWRYLATQQGWIPGLIAFAIAWAAARLWPRRQPG
jgi:hypothetical protein